MGLGDWILASGQAEQIPGPVVFGNGERVYYEEEIFSGNPKISRIGKGATWVANFPGSRPYIQEIDTAKKFYTFNPNYRAPYGKIYLTEQERSWAAEQVKGDFILVEPFTKEPIGGFLYLGRNKRWDKWEQLLKLDYPWLQVGQKPPMTRQVPTKSFRRAMALIERARLVITTDGAVHHAAAALGVPAIVLWGGVVSPRVLGYPTHINVWNGATPCGTFGHECDHCKEAMRSIALDQVTRHL